MYDSNKFIRAQTAPNDTPNCISFNPIHDYFSVASWDGTIRLYNTLTLDHKLLHQEAKPILSTVFNEEGNICFGGTSEGKMLAIEVATNKTMKFDAHTQAINHIKVFNNLVITGSYDKTIKFWDLRTPNAVHTINLPERVYAMDIGKSNLVVGMASNKITCYDLKNNCAEKPLTPRLFWQIRTLHAKEDDDTILVGGVEGKLELMSKFTNKSVVLKLHRTKDEIYPINFVTSMPNKEIIVTGGGDNKIIFFDKNTNNKLIEQVFDSPITCGSFNSRGNVFAFGVGYDWSRGYEVNNLPNNIYLLNCAGMI